jgi:hypothetical protein
MASTDARPVPQKNVAYRITFPLLDADGDLVTGAAGLDSEVSKDGGTFTDCTNEATEIATSSGMYFLDLTSTEMNADTVAIIIKTSTSGGKTTPIVLYPEEAGDIRVNVTQVNGTAQTAGDLKASIAAVQSDTDDIQTRLPAALVSGRMDSSVGAMAANVLTATAINADAITAAKIADGAIDAGALASDTITAAKIAASALNGKGDWNIGKTGYALSAAGVQAVWDALTSALSTVGSIGKLLVDNINATISSRLASASYTAPLDAAGTRSAVGLASANLDTQLDALPTAQENADAVWSADITLGVNTDHADGALMLIRDAVDTEVGAIKAVTDKLDTALELDGAVYRYTANALEQGPSGSGPTAAAIADAVWDEVLSGHLTSGTTGAGLNAAGSAGDPWSTALPGAYGAGTAGKIIGDNINATISSRASQGSVDTVDDFLDTEIAAIKAKTDNLPTDPADASDIAAAFSTVNANLSTVAGYIDTEVAAIKSKTDNLPASPAATADCITAAGVRSAVGLASANLDTQLDALPTNAELSTALAAADDAVLAEIALVKAKTDNLPTDPADQSAVEAAITAAVSPLATQASVNTIDDFLDTEIAAIKTKTDQLSFGVTGKVDANITHVNETEVSGTGATGDEWGPV